MTDNLIIDPLPGTPIVTSGFGAISGDPSTCRDAFTLPPPPTPPAVLGPYITVVNLYWGDYYREGNAGFAKRYWIDDRAEFVFNDDRFWAPLREYSTASQPISGGDWGWGWGANEALTSGNLAGSDIETELAKEIDGFATGTVSATFPGLQSQYYHPGSNALYVIWLPPGVTNSPDLDGAFGYHTYFSHNGQNVPYAVLGFLDAWEGYEDSMFVTETHEVYEAVSDPWLNSGWRDGTGNEIGDVCGRAALGTAAITEWVAAGGEIMISVQKEWSRLKCDCVDIMAYGGELTAPPPSPGGWTGGGGTRPCGGPGKPPCPTVQGAAFDGMSRKQRRRFFLGRIAWPG